jgi:hypothetical protein
LSHVEELIEAVGTASEDEAKKQELVQGNFVKRKDVPDYLVKFSMGRLQFTLIEDLQTFSGIEFVVKDFEVQLKLFDTQNKFQKYRAEANLINRHVAVNVLSRDGLGQITNCAFLQSKTLPFSQQLEDLSEANQAESPLALDLNIVLGNINHQQSDLPQNEKVKVDLGIKMRMKPMEIIYQARAIENLYVFFRVQNLSASTKIAARAQFEMLT